MASKTGWESLTDIAKRFWDDAGEYVSNVLSLERIVDTQDVATQRLKDFQIAINQAAGTKHKTGKPKKLDRAEDKAKSDYKGDMQRVTDYARGKMIVDSPEQVKAIAAILDDRNSELLQEHGICVVSKKDYFADPKENTGYRCMNYKIAIPVGEDDNWETERQVVELQVVASQIEKINDLTHPFKRRGEDIVAKCVDEERDPDKEERYEVFLCFATSRYYNGLISGNNGYDVLLDPDKRQRFAMSPAKQENELRHVRNLRELDRERDDLGDYIARQEAPVDPADIKAGLDEKTGHWVRYGIYRPAGHDPEFYEVTMVRDYNDPDVQSKSVDDLQEDDFVFHKAMRWDFENAEWEATRQGVNDVNSSNFSDRYSQEEYHERMLRHESTLVRRHFEESGVLDARRDAKGLTHD